MLQRRQAEAELRLKSRKKRRDGSTALHFFASVAWVLTTKFAFSTGLDAPLTLALLTYFFASLWIGRRRRNRIVLICLTATVPALANLCLSQKSVLASLLAATPFETTGRRPGYQRLFWLLVATANFVVAVDRDAVVLTTGLATAAYQALLSKARRDGLSLDEGKHTPADETALVQSTIPYAALCLLPFALRFEGAQFIQAARVAQGRTMAAFLCSAFFGAVARLTDRPFSAAPLRKQSLAHFKTICLVCTDYFLYSPPPLDVMRLCGSGLTAFSAIAYTRATIRQGNTKKIGDRPLQGISGGSPVTTRTATATKNGSSARRRTNLEKKSSLPTLNKRRRWWRWWPRGTRDNGKKMDDADHLEDPTETTTFVA